MLTLDEDGGRKEGHKLKVSKTKRIASIQVCRGFAAILVVLSHLHNVEAKYCSTHHMQIFRYGVLGVDLFFVISGFVIASVTYGRFGNRHDAVDFLYCRFARVYPIFWVYTSIALLGYLYKPNWFNSTYGHKVNILASYLLVPSNTPMLISQGWTLSFEVYFYLVISLLLLIASRRSALWILAIYGTIVVGIPSLLHLQLHPVFQTMCNPLFLEFTSGFIIFHIYRKSRLHPAVGAVIACAAFIWLGAIILYNARIHGGDVTSISEHAWQRTLLYGSFAALLIMGAVEMERTGIVCYFGFLEDIGEWSYSIYLSHLMIVELIGRIAHQFVPTMHSLILLIDLICIPMVLLTGFLSYKYLERPFMRFLNTRKRTLRALAH